MGFPSASQPDFDFIRQLIDEDLIPDDVTIQVLVQCRPELIERTYECLRGAKNAIVHFYNSTSELQRQVVFGLDTEGITHIATDAARLCKKLESSVPRHRRPLRVQPRELHRHRGRVRDRDLRGGHGRHRADAERPLILNLPATVEMYTANVYGDVIEWFHRTMPQPRPHRACRCTRTTTGAARSRPPSSASWPAPTASRARCSATASAPATSTSSPWR